MRPASDTHSNYICYIIVKGGTNTFETIYCLEVLTSVLNLIVIACLIMIPPGNIQIHHNFSIAAVHCDVIIATLRVMNVVWVVPGLAPNAKHYELFSVLDVLVVPAAYQLSSKRQ